VPGQYQNYQTVVFVLKLINLECPPVALRTSGLILLNLRKNFP